MVWTNFPVTESYMDSKMAESQITEGEMKVIWYLNLNIYTNYDLNIPTVLIHGAHT